MLKVFFTTPPTSLEKRYGSLAGGGSSAPSLGILSLAAVARQAGFDCHLVDASALVLTEAELLQRLAELQPEILCLSSTTLAIGNAHALAAAAKRQLPRLQVILGGPHVTAAPDATMEKFPAFDIAVIGEGEATLVELLPALGSGGDLNQVAGILFRQGGDLQRTPRRPFITDLDALPFPAWDLLDSFPQRYLPAPFKVRQLPAATLVTSRGCPNACIFCDRSVFGTSCHGYSADYVVRQMVELHRRYGIREFSFEDDTFITFKGRLQEICDRLIRLRLGLSWTCLGRVNHVTPENLRLMRQAGCWQISFGIESGSPQLLTLINKRITLDQVRQAVGWSREAGIRTKGFFILGHPGETRQTLKLTRDFALELPLNDISVSLMTPFPGTELYARAAEFGQFDPDWEKMNLLSVVFIPHDLTQEDLVTAQKELIRSFYFRPRVVADYGRRLLGNPSMVAGLWHGFRALLHSIRR
ncbi:MAG: cobalamin B12-binding domain-containing protein [Desulfuromonadales bacterium]|nr:cobalamin B12-binding domain-containing protein [Desulfuromonadales bacterium]